MRIILTSVFVDDQAKALAFYTDVLGFVQKNDMPLAPDGPRWITVASPDDPDGVELLLEPDGHPAVKPFKAALVADGIPCTSFAVADVRKEHERLTAARRTVHPGADRDGSGDHRGFRRHLRQSHPDRPAQLTSPPGTTAGGHPNAPLVTRPCRRRN